MMKKALSLLFLFSTGCATSPYQGLGSDFSAEYRQDIQSLPLAEQPTKSCYEANRMVEKEWHWKKAVLAANVCFKTRNLEKTEDLAKKLATREPSAPWGPFYLAQVAKARHQFERALWLSELSIRRAPEIGLLHYLKGQVLFDQSNFDESVRSFRKSVDLDSSLTEAHLLLGQIFFRDQDYDQAVDHFLSAGKKETTAQAALTGLAETYVQQKNYRASLETYGRLARVYSYDGQYLKRMAEIYLTHLDNAVEALSCYRNLADLQARGKITINKDSDLRAKIATLSGQGDRSIASVKAKGNGGRGK